MYGAILGDMIGAPYEFDQGKNIKTLICLIQGSNIQMILR